MESSVGSPAEANIETVARLEQEFLERRSRLERIASAVADFSGSAPFIAVHVVGLILWVVLNSGRVPFLRPFDPYPYILLSALLSCEAVLLSAFVLMKQNLMSRRADQRAHLDLQISLLAEKEVTKLLQMQRRICEKLGIPDAADQEAQKMSEETAVENLAHDLEEKLPDG
jgi:uncharacterized membrane protein